MFLAEQPSLLLYLAEVVHVIHCFAEEAASVIATQQRHHISTCSTHACNGLPTHAT